MDLTYALLVNLFGLTLIGFLIIFYIVLIVGRWFMFKKMGAEGWESLIPFYSTYTEYRYTWIGRMWIFSSGFLAVGRILTYNKNLTLIASLLLLISTVSRIIGFYRLSKAFGKGILFTVLLLISEPIFTAVLGLGSSTYIGNTYENDKIR